ncbi:MAG: YjbH domain-containing protein [Simkania sp.]|nr:YjbH domain-containing protein [Simkania sp.]
MCAKRFFQIASGTITSGLKNKLKLFLYPFLVHCSYGFTETTSTSLSIFDELALVEKINAEVNDTLPFFYNASMIGGYFNMPSARMPPLGTVALGGGRVKPYNVYGISFQPLSRIELSGNYRVYTGITDAVLGPSGFGDEAERIGNIKIALLAPEDGFDGMPILSFGADDFFGTARFNSQYGVMTKQWKRYNLEASLGWGKGRLKGFFGGFAWSPWRKTDLCFLKGISLLAEWDAFDYKKHPHEHPAGREVHSRINAGISYIGWDALQISLSSLRGTTFAATASLRYPIGTSPGLFTKVQDPPNYQTPVDVESLGVTRPEYRFAQELAYAFSDQGLDLYSVYLYENEYGKALWIKVVNNRYRQENVFRERVQDLLAALTPSDIKTITVVNEADALPCQEYIFRNEDLQRLRLGLIGEHEMKVISPRKEAQPHPKHGLDLFQRSKDIWAFTIRPRLLTFFGSATGKFKYNVGLLSSINGYLFDQFYYNLQLAYSIHSTTWSMSDIDRINPSQLLNVRTDTIRYFQNNTISLEKAFIQKGLNLGRSWFYRAAAGYFEPAYGGLASEFLLYPANSSWAVGVEGAGLLKRRYSGLGFTEHVRKLHGFTPTYPHYIGYQYFLNLYYQFKPLQLDFKVMAGSFLARDKGARFEIGRVFPSGFRLSLWYTITNGHDKVNGQTYYDKGFAFSIPLDFFLPQSSRSYIGYAMSAWLRDIGAIAETGKPLYMTLREERF